MKIESLIKPTKTDSRKVICFGTTYEFTRIAKDRFVAMVENEDAIRVMLGNPKAYREFTDELGTLDAGAGTLQRTATPPKAPAPAKTEAPAPAPVAPTPATEPKAPAEPPAKTAEQLEAAEQDTSNAAQALLAATPNAIKRQLEKKTPPLAVLNKAIAIESAADKPRPLVLSGLKAAAEQAADKTGA